MVDVTRIEFVSYPKTVRHYRDITISEKIDGTNAGVGIIELFDEDLDANSEPLDANIIDYWELDDGNVYGIYAQSRNRLIRPGKDTDNAGFAAWVSENSRELIGLLPKGLHLGEWWGQGIQRNYGLKEKRFSLFNTHAHQGIYERSEGLLRTVPVLYQGPNQGARVEEAMQYLAEYGSEAETGFANPEGVCVYHSASKQVTKVTFEHDNTGKWAA